MIRQAGAASVPPSPCYSAVVRPLATPRFSCLRHKKSVTSSSPFLFRMWIPSVVWCTSHHWVGALPPSAEDGRTSRLRRLRAAVARSATTNPFLHLGRSLTNGSFDDHWNEEQLQNFEPLAYAIFYSALNSLKAEVVQSRFKKDKLSLLRKYQQGLEFSLQQADFLTTSSIEVLQAFIIYLVCIDFSQVSGPAD